MFAQLGVQVLEHDANGSLQHFSSLFAIAFAGLLRFMCASGRQIWTADRASRPVNSCARLRTARGSFGACAVAGELTPAGMTEQDPRRSLSRTI
jgi:hypothetical protein